MDHEPITPWSELEHILFDESAEPKALPLSFLEHITNGFSDDNEIGYGGFARVYKGMLDNGTVVAVKKLFNTFDIDEKKFIEEVCCLMKAKQKNIVRFLGYCSNTQGEILQFEGKPVLAEVRQRALCFEYLPKGSLDKQITDASCGLEWSKRYQIITGICDGLYYLHQKRILHLDLKPENILLDDNMIPKIADFGLSRCFDEKQSRAITSKPIGTLGYLPPEFYGGHITFKLDIYSLGIIITEMLTGEKGYPNIANVLERWRNRLEKTQGDTQLVQVRVCTEIAIQCTDSDPLKRPDTQHIIDRIGATKSVDESAAETGPSSSSSVAQSTEVAVLPRDELWPFLLRFPISAFEMCLGVSSQAMLWKTLESEPSMAFLRVCPAANHVLWWASIALTAVVSIVYLLKVIFYFEAVRREFHHPVRVNFFFAPWVACLFLVKGVPRLEWEIHHVFWYLLMAPILCLDLKIYGQWMSSGERRLSKVANPSNHLAVVGNFVGALLGAMMGLRDLPIFFFAIGLAHYAVLFVTLYQRLPTNVQLPKELHPVFFLFVATPSVASMAWARISGEFNNGAKLLYFVSLFLYVSLVVRVNLFRGLRFSLAWWAYTFPMTSVALATVLYALEENNMLTQTLAVGLSGIAVVTVIGVLATTVYHAFVCGDLFPNDVSIAITRKRPKFSNILAHLRLPTPASSSPSSTSQFHLQARHLL